VAPEEGAAFNVLLEAFACVQPGDVLPQGVLPSQIPDFCGQNFGDEGFGEEKRAIWIHSWGVVYPRLRDHVVKAEKRLNRQGRIPRYDQFFALDPFLFGCAPWGFLFRLTCPWTFCLMPQFWL